ncbi:hypothetical protein [Prescottella subtropica]|uniref:hypothetical protein n=1 Tax=Prescottella subtropica TaxID=2545757 RepID=UPI0010F8F37E|nr:hypothetical protein [Prescottella subtropica]
MRIFDKAALVAATVALAALAAAAPVAAAHAGPFDFLTAGSLGSLGPSTPGTDEPGTDTPGPEQPTGPTVTLSKSTGIAAAGETITVTGTDFSGAGAGLYIGLVQDDKYSATDSSAWMTTAWLKPAQIVDGAWTVDVDALAVTGTSNCLVNTCSIYTVAAHGSADRTQDTKSPVTFAG